MDTKQTWFYQHFFNMRGKPGNEEKCIGPLFHGADIKPRVVVQQTLNLLKWNQPLRFLAWLGSCLHWSGGSCLHKRSSWKMTTYPVQWTLPPTGCFERRTCLAMWWKYPASIEIWAGSQWKKGRRKWRFPHWPSQEEFSWLIKWKATRCKPRSGFSCHSYYPLGYPVPTTHGSASICQRCAT